MNLVEGDMILYDDGHMIVGVRAEFLYINMLLGKKSYWFLWHDDMKPAWIGEEDLVNAVVLTRCPMEVKDAECW